MTAKEVILRVVSRLEPIVPALAAAAIVTFAAAMVLYLLCRNAWIDKKRFQLLGILFGLGSREQVALACSWLKLVLVAVYVVRFRSLEPVEYVLLVFPGILGAFGPEEAKKWLENLFWLALQCLGMVSLGTLCRFATEVGNNERLIWVYAGMGGFMILFSLYLFLGELGSLSRQRNIDPRAIWGREETQ